MRKLILIVLTAMNIAYGIGQQNLLNDHLEDIIYSQITNELEINIPVLFTTSKFIIFYTLEFHNNKILFEETKALRTNIASPKQILQNEIKQLLNCNFIQHVARDTSYAITAFYKNRQLIKLTYLDSDGEQIITIKSPDGKLSQEIRYANNRINYLAYKKESSLEMDQLWYTDSLTKIISYNSQTKQYEVVEHILQNGCIVSKIYYKKSQNREKKKVAKTEKYFYDKNNQFIGTETYDKFGNVIAFSKYTYENGMLAGMKKHSENSKEEVYFTYDSNSRLTAKKIITEDEKLNIRYTYNEADQVQSLSIMDEPTYSKDRYEFEYNTEHQLMSIKIFDMLSGGVNNIFKAHYSFTYNNDGMIESVREIGFKGNVLKEIKYELQYIMNK